MQMSAPAILLDSEGYEILLGTSFLVQYLATADFGQEPLLLWDTLFLCITKLEQVSQRDRPLILYMMMV